jgi:YggT family protein
MFVLGNALSTIATLIGFLAHIYFFALLGNVICSWVNADPYNPIVRFIRRITDPVLDVIRRFLPPIAGLDFSPFVAMLALQFVVQGFLVSTLHDLAIKIQ